MAQTPAQRRAAQRRLRAQVKSGSFQRAPRYYRQAVKRGITRGQMRAYVGEINAIVAVGAGVETTTITGVTKSERQLIAKHRELTLDVINAKNDRERARAEKKLQSFVRRHPYTGGDNPQEFASDVPDIVTAYLADPDDFSFENLYPESV